MVSINLRQKRFGDALWRVGIGTLGLLYTAQMCYERNNKHSDCGIGMGAISREYGTDGNGWRECVGVRLCACERAFFACGSMRRRFGCQALQCFALLYAPR